MGDKISALPAATSVDGTELIPIVQGGTTKKVTGLILRNPAGVAGGDLTGTYPNPTLASVTTAQTGVGSGLSIPVLTVDAKGRVTGLTTVANPALTTVQIAGLSTTAASPLASSGVAGTSLFASRADHQHAYPTAANVGALGATAAASGDLAGNYPGPTLAAITTAQSNVGNSTNIPVISVDAKGRVISLSSVAIATSTSAISSLTGDVTAVGPGAAAATLAAITTAQNNVGSGTAVPVLSIDAKGRVISLGSVPITSEAGGTVTSITAGTGLDGGTIIESGTISLAAITTAQVDIGSTSQIPVLSINAQGQVTALSSVAFSGGGAPLATTAPAALATAAVVGLSTEAARADHQHIFPTAIQIGALTTSQIAGMSTVAPAALATSAVIGLSTFAARADHQHVYPTPAQIGALSTSQFAGMSTVAPAALATSAVIGLSTFAARADHQHIFPTPQEIGAVPAIQGTALIVAGGGGATGAGGGAGGMQTVNVSFYPGQVCTVTVGAGGAGAIFTGTAVSGSNSLISYGSVVGSIGGGRCGVYGTPSGTAGANGGSGGGGGTNGAAGGPVALGGSGTVGQGNSGGYTPGLSGSPSGGGGGAGSAGVYGFSSSGGNGGSGLQSSITGTATYYAGGGGGSVGSGSQGSGGFGGGGNAVGGSGGTGGSGVANTGGGAGGAASLTGTGGNGGSGVVILSLPTVNYTGIVTGSPTVTTSGANTIIKFTSSGTYTA